MFEPAITLALSFPKGCEMSSRASAAPDGRRWLALAFVLMAQLMIILDVTVVNIALPTAQKDLGISDGDRQWVVTAYTLAFGSLLLLGGRIADYAGRKRTFMIGLFGFSVASAIGGAAPDFTTLLAARALQGVFAALLAPSVLSLVTVTFKRPEERAKAFAVFGIVAAGGGAVGLLLGGALTEYLDWRWCLYVNLPIAVVAAFGWFVLPSDQRSAERPRYDLPGTVLAVGGLLAVVYGCSEAESEGWGSGLVLGMLAAGVVMLGAFAAVEARTANPLLPLRVVLNRTRGSAYFAVGLAMFAMLSTFLYLTFFMQVVLEYSALETGLAFLPMTVGVLVAAGGVGRRLVPRVAPRTLIAPGMLIGAGGLAWLSTMETGSEYASLLLPAMTVIGFGMGLMMAPAINYATHDVGPEDAGVASAGVNTMQQIGGAIGTALLNTIAATATADYVAGRPKSPTLLKEGLAHGFADGFGVAAVILAAAALIVAALMNTPRPVRGGTEVPGDVLRKAPVG